MSKFFSILKKIFKWFFITVFILLVLATGFIVISGKTYIFNAVFNTYLKGQSGPGILDKEVFYSREIAPGEPEPWPLAPLYGKVMLSSEQEERLAKYSTTSFLVFQRDSLLLESYFEDFDVSTVSNSFSMSKSVVSMCIGIAIDEGKIKGVDQKVSDFIPDYKEGKRAELTLWHLLTMSAALDWTESGGNPLSDNAEAYYGWNLEGMIHDVQVVGEPGKEFYYQSGATLILAYCLEKATGKKISDYVSEKIWSQIGAENTAFWSLDKEHGLEKSYCCLYATARDFARFGKLYEHKGKWNDKQIVSEKWVEESLTPANLMEDGKPYRGYGYQWWLMEYEGMKTFYMRGIKGQYVICIPEKELIIVRTGHDRSAKKINDHPEDVFIYLDVALQTAK